MIPHPQNNSDAFDARLHELSATAWAARSNAHIHGKTRVGSAVLASSGQIYAGCNLEHRFRCHDIHAEVNALSSMIASGDERVLAILVVAEREYFMPCGGCLDWIMELSQGDVIVAFQPSPGADVRSYTATELMPHYPR